MNYNVIGKNIRTYRIAKKLSQQELGERVGLSTTYIGMVERGEKTLSLEAFISVVNALEITADMLLAELMQSGGYEVKNSLLNEKLMSVEERDRAKIYDVIDTMIKHSKRIPR